MNKLIVVTGGSKGIGRAIIEKFAKEGFDIATTSRSEADLKRLSQIVQEQYPWIKFYYKPADLSDRKQVGAFADFILGLNRNIEVLVNNSGLYIPGQIQNEPEGNLELMLNTNLYSAYHLTRALIGTITAARHGHIFNMCSIASITAYANGGSYCISKFALYGMGKVLREEMKPYGVKVTNILPGATKTASWDGVDLPEERFIMPQDIAEVMWSAYNLSSSAVVEDLIIRPQPGDI